MIGVLSFAVLAQVLVRVGRSQAPVHIFDNLLAADDFDQLHGDMRGADFHDGPGNNFPGWIAQLKDSVAIMVVGRLLRSKALTRYYPDETFKQELITGFASVLCRAGVPHHDAEGEMERS